MHVKNKQGSLSLSATAQQKDLVLHWTKRCNELLQDRRNLQRDDLEYLVEKAASLKDERFKACIAELIGWGDKQRAELETFCAIALETMKLSSPSKLRDAAMKVELRYRLAGEL